MIFWVSMLIVWFILAMNHITAAGVMGVGFLLAIVGSLLGVRSPGNRFIVILFLCLGIWQMFSEKNVLYEVDKVVKLDKFEYPPEVRNDKMAQPRYDLRMALHPHGAWEEWLKSRFPCSMEFALADQIEEEYQDWLKKRQDTEDLWIQWAEDRFDDQIQEMCFSKNMQKYILARHMKYHGCTEEELLTSGRNVLESYMKSQVKK